MYKHCSYCNGKFTPKYRQSERYCSNSCRSKYNWELNKLKRTKDKECPICNMHFKTSNSRKQTCSKKCSVIFKQTNKHKPERKCSAKLVRLKYNVLNREKLSQDRRKMYVENITDDTKTIAQERTKLWTKRHTKYVRLQKQIYKKTTTHLNIKIVKDNYQYLLEEMKKWKTMSL